MHPADDLVDVLLVAEAGGHLYELEALKGAWHDYSHAWATLPGPQSERLKAEGERVFEASGPTCRSAANLLLNLVTARRVLKELKPRLILVTGAGISVPFAWIGAVSRIPVLYLECAGRVDRSLSLRLIAPIASEVFVQWPETEAAQRGARFVGNLFLPI